MKKRSKLDLSAGVAPGKPQAAGFDQMASAEPDHEPREASARPAAQGEKPRRASVMSEKRSYGALVVKTVVVVAVAALSIYLMKRRVL